MIRQECKCQRVTAMRHESHYESNPINKIKNMFSRNFSVKFNTIEWQNRKKSINSISKVFFFLQKHEEKGS